MDYAPIIGRHLAAPGMNDAEYRAAAKPAFPPRVWQDAKTIFAADAGC